MPSSDPQPPRVRQAVLAARELAPTVERLRSELDLGEPFSDPAVQYFGLHNAVFALGDTFLEVVSPLRADTAAGRLLERRGGDCGYMVMFQVADLAAARARAAERQVREVFELALEDIAEVHLHPTDMRGAIVSLSAPQPPASWRWGGPDWSRRASAARVAGVGLAVEDPTAVRQLWSHVLGTPAHAAGVELTAAPHAAGLAEIAIARADGVRREPIEIGGVRFAFV